MELPANGAVLGIDVGYSNKRATTGFCGLWWDTDSVDWKCCNVTSANSERVQALREVLQGERSLLAVAIDGPLRPHLQRVKAYRAAESLLSRGAFQKRGKPGQTNSPNGWNLHREATRLAELALSHFLIGAARVSYTIHERAICEAFPNLFLGLLHDEEDYPKPQMTRRKWTDGLYPRVRQRLELLLSEVLENRKVLGVWELGQHDEIASFVCALTALAYATRTCVAVGAQNDGFMIMPPVSWWGRTAAASGRWAERELLRNFAEVTREFPAARVFYGDRPWLAAEPDRAGMDRSVYKN